MLPLRKSCGWRKFGYQPEPLDPAAHHVAAARHQIDVVRRRAGEQAEDFVAHRFGAALVGIEAEDPVVLAGLDRAVAQVAEAVERHLAPRARRARVAISAVRSVLNELTTTTSSAHSTLETAASIFSASL